MKLLRINLGIDIEMIWPKAEYRIFSEIRENSGEQVGEFNTAKQVHMTWQGRLHTIRTRLTYVIFIFENTFSIFEKLRSPHPAELT